MNKITAVCFSALIAAPMLSLATDAQHDDAKTSAKTDRSAKKATDGTTSSMMMDNMKKMQDQMTKLRATKDPKEREKLMHEHMQTMQETMKMMHGSQDMMTGAKQDGKRMDRMQMMMDQMMDHQNAMQGMGK